MPEPLMPMTDESSFQTPPSDDAPDPELMRLVGGGDRDSILKPILMITVIVMGFWMLDDWREEVAYLFSPSEPVSLGTITDYPVERSRDPSWEPELPHNRYVSLEGVPTQRSQSPRYRFFKLIGHDLYIEQERDDYIADPIEREMADSEKGDVDRVYYKGTGRLVAFEKMSERYGGLRNYYGRRYGTVFCDQIDDRQRAEIERRRRDSVIQQWRLEFKEATPEERERDSLTPEPTEAELTEVLSSEPICQEAWLIQDGVEPKDHWWYVAMAAMFLGFMLFNAVLLVRWILRFVRS